MSPTDRPTFNDLPEMLNDIKRQVFAPQDDYYTSEVSLLVSKDHGISLFLVKLFHLFHFPTLFLCCHFCFSTISSHYRGIFFFFLNVISSFQLKKSSFRWTSAM